MVTVSFLCDLRFLSVTSKLTYPHFARYCDPLLVFPCTVKSRSSLLAPAHPGDPGKRAVKRWWWWWIVTRVGPGAVSKWVSV